MDEQLPLATAWSVTMSLLIRCLCFFSTFWKTDMLLHGVQTMDVSVFSVLGMSMFFHTHLEYHLGKRILQLLLHGTN